MVMWKILNTLYYLILVILVSITILLSCAYLVEAQPLQNIKVDFTWTHNGEFTTGYRLYKGPTPSTLVKAIDIPGNTVRTYSFTSVETLPICFGMSAFGPSGESSIVSSTTGGVNVCVGKPVPLSSFSFSVR